MKNSLIRIILVSLFCALICAGAFIRIPLPLLPVTLQTLFVLTASMLLPLSLALEAVLLYLFLGLIGLPVFTAGGGVAAFFGPTGGYLLGMIPAVLTGSLVSGRSGNVLRNLLAALLATAAIYIPGLLVLKSASSLSWSAAVTVGLLPFIIGDLLKIIVSSLCAATALPKIRDLLENSAQ